MISKAALKIFLGILIVGIFSSPLTAQTTEEETAPPETTGSAADLKITPRVGAGYNSSAAGHDGFGRFEGFVPLLQNPGSDLLFLEGRLLVDNGAQLGGNILLGYRAFNPELNRSFGGYIGYDNRDTGDSTFNQIGLGLESLGAIWDFRLNGYLPVGDTRQVVASSTFDSGFQLAGTPFFQGNSLVLTGERIFQSTTIQEAAMSGLDFEVGAKLAEFTNGGEVRGYGGIYYYDASGSPSTVGGKLRVEVRPTDYLNLGLGVQHDDLFGTNILFTVGGTFPGTRPSGYRQERDEPKSVWARMGESVSRTASIIVDQQVESESFTEQLTTIATNPDTGQPWVFAQVAEGGSGSGTFESPFGTVLEGVGIAQSDGNHIVYVRSGAAADTGTITIPAQVQLLSAGVLQQINTQEFGLVTLPFSGSGQLTNFTGTITMEDQSVLSGFNLTSNNGPGITVRDLNFVTIRDSSITSSSEAALLLENTTGTIALSNTTLTGNGAPALVGTNINNLTFAGGSLTSTNSVTNGITLNGISSAVDISNIPIIITNPQVNGIAASNVTGSLNLANAQISGSQAAAILLQNSTGAISIRDSNVVSSSEAALLLENTTGNIALTNTNLTGDGVPVLVGTTINNLIFTGGSLTSTNSVTNGITFEGISGAVDISNIPIIITTPQVNGVAAANVTGSLTLANGQITSSQAEAFLLENSTGAIAISEFEITDAGGTGIFGNNLANLTLSENQISGAQTNGISIANLTGIMTVTGDEITSSQAEGILLEDITGTIDISGVTITETGSSGIAGVNLANVTLRENQISEAQNRGIILEQIIDGTVQIANNTITDTVGVLPPTPTATNPPTGQGIALFDVTGTIDITANEITGTTGFIGNVDTTNPDNSYLASGQGIAFVNTTAEQVNLNLAANTITGNANQGVALANLLGTIAITSNNISNTTGSTGNIDNINPENNELFTGEGIAFNNDTVQNVNLTIVGNTLTNNTSRGISLGNLIGQVTIDNNEITDTQGEIPFDGASTGFPVGQGIVFANDTGEVDLTIANNQILRNVNQGILLTDINGIVNIDSNIITDTNGELAIIAFNDLATLDFSVLTSITSINDFSDPAALDEMAAAIASDLATGQGIVVANAPNTLLLNINNNEILNNRSQGIALDNLTDTVNITGNTITDTSGLIGGIIDFPTGQGILATHISGDLNLNISENNQISNNFEDGLVIVLGDPSGMLPVTTTPTADITISGNEFQTNGMDTTDTRGDGIRIFLEGDAIVNNLNISNNTVTNNRDDGIQISQGDLTLALSGNGGTSQLNNATISNNTVESNRDNGINVRSFGGTVNLVIQNNPSISQNLREGIDIFAGAALGSNAEINVDVLSNVLTDNAIPGFRGTATNVLDTPFGVPIIVPVGGRLCANLDNNRDTDYQLTNVGGTLEVESLVDVNVRNTGNVIPVGAMDAGNCL
ncbi:MAG: right-handed parallel beta-helix repeat-containing protein [Symploca sp. SIO2C1]|nr:right-handed parallel beta-helix repeat-containing protein [Symploca sp. SIO2C1]